uniref:Uncharacterized protein n=1 Tax=Octopus bimaculoides TaxID=37653 RepID=A0A0L8G8M8_OCTBM
MKGRVCKIIYALLGTSSKDYIKTQMIRYFPHILVPIITWLTHRSIQLCLHMRVRCRKGNITSKQIYKNAVEQ